MRTRLPVGIVGCGHLLQKGLLRHLLQPDLQERMEVVALCDSVGERARAVAEQYGIPQHFHDLNRMLARAGVEAVLILTPVQLHHEHALNCLRAGKHVYVQKALATTYAEALEICQEAQHRDRVLTAAPGQMLCPAYRQMKRTLAEGGIGRPMWCYAGATYGNDLETVTPEGLDTSWQYLYGGGALWNCTVYSLHALTGILGPVRRVTAMMERVVPERTRRGTPFSATEADNSLLTLEMDHQVLATVWGCRSATGAVLDWGSIGFYGTEGSVEATSIHGESGWPDRVEWRRGGQVRHFCYPAGGFRAGEGWEVPLAPDPHADIVEQHVYLDVVDFVRAVTERGSGYVPEASPTHAAHVVEVLEKSYVAARTGQAQEIASTL